MHGLDDFASITSKHLATIATILLLLFGTNLGNQVKNDFLSKAR